MAPRDKRLEQSAPRADSPIKKWKREQPAPSTYKGKFKPKQDLPRGTITQNRAKPGKTSPQ